ncbi:hypothetical protein QTG56_25075 (plasmid) [Rossellomorea sp. AcN35-11]|nr:hypothetical protein [Rossellomorea aquimaris]WJV31907.1 hypothetical protein QTG56_25075 [Rossellomorea sp. AcN35-11]
MFHWIKGKPKEEPENEVVLEVTAPFNYLDSESNTGALVGDFDEYEVRIDPFNQNALNPHVGVIGSGGAGKTNLIKSMLKHENRDMDRFVISTRGYEFKDVDNTMVHSKMVINPFHIKTELKERSFYVLEFFKRFTELKHNPVERFDPFDEYCLMDFITKFFDKCAHEEIYTISSFERELKAERQLIEEKADYHMRLFSQAYQESNKKPHQFFTNYKEQFNFVEDLNRIGSYKKIEECIACMRSEDILKYFDGPSNVYPVMGGITVIDLMELEIHIYKFSKNTPLVITTLLDHLHEKAKCNSKQERIGKTAIYIDPILDFMSETPFFKKTLQTNMARGRKNNISYRLVGIHLDREYLEQCHHIIQMGPLTPGSVIDPLKGIEERRYLKWKQGIIAKGGREFLYTPFNAKPNK